MGGPAEAEQRRFKFDDMPSMKPAFFGGRKRIFQQRIKVNLPFQKY